nr:atp-dependent dna helicase ii subunit 1 [Quercus suber]
MPGSNHNGHKPPEDEDDEEEEEEEADDTGYKTIKDAVLFAIDVNESMLTRPDEIDEKKADAGLSPTLAALKCAYALMQQRIISNPNDMMGILLFGTEQSRFQEGDETGKGKVQYPHCYLLTDLDVPAAADVKHLRDLVEDNEEADKLLVASGEEVSMANVLFCANQIFTTKAPNFSSRRLFLVTDNDYPHANHRDARNSAAVRAKDLYDLGVTIELFPISHPDKGYTFDRNKFYNDIVYSSTPADPDAPAPLTTDIQPANSGMQEGITLLQSLLSSVASRAAPKRALFSSIPFEIGPHLRIGIKGFIIIKRQEPRRTTYVYLPPDSEKAQIAVGSTTLLADDTARTVENPEIRKAYKFGGETISFSVEELSQIQNFGDPILRIIGFKPMSLLPIWASTRPSTFIYPSEEDYIGSTRVFSALHQKLLKDEKMAIAWYIARRNAAPVIAAVTPGAEQRTAQGEQTIPPGLWVKPLPFADDIREPPETNLIQSTDELTDAMRTVVQQLQLPGAVYDPQKYPNPSLQWFYRILQALALDEDLPEKPEDKTNPKWRQIHKRAGGFVTTWGEVLEEAFREWQKSNSRVVHPQAGGGAKRSTSAASDAAGRGQIKKVKQEDDEAPTDDDVRSAYEKNKIAKFKVAELKSFLHGKGQGKGLSKKADLIDAIVQYFETKMDIS